MPINTNVDPDMGWYWLKTYPKYCHECRHLESLYPIEEEDYTSQVSDTNSMPSWIMITDTIFKKIDKTDFVFICDKLLDITYGVDIDAYYNGLITKHSIALCKLKNCRSARWK